ncbi:MAG: nitrogenase molybdenum-iron protein subunit beta [Victivallales bacterium]|nr:nitrogenase molybdenum-iron protein subunit beta [Victivallales bacterium]
MLLKHTPKEIKERNALTINPAKTCQPIGAMYAALGIHGCLPHSHGSQGCCSYHRSALTRHYKEPVMAGTSSFTEGASVFGGQANLIQAINNIFTVYNPDIIAIHTTCLSETIGDDVNQIVGKAVEENKVPEGKRIMYCSTPSYIGSHVTGFSNMVEGIIREFPVSTGTKNRKINIIPGWVEPSDMREIKALAKTMGVEIIMFPDTSDVMDAPQTGTHEFYPRGGTTIAQLEAAGDAKYTLALGKYCSEAGAIALENKCGIKFKTLDLPIGISATDRFISTLSNIAGIPVPQSITDERGRLVDMITDMQQYLYCKKVALWGDPDQLIALTEFLLDLDAKPAFVVSGTPGKYFMERMEQLLGKDMGGAKVQNGSCADMFLMHQWIKNEGCDLLLGNTYGKYIARDENIPFVRMGFPIYDRVGHSYFPTVGYKGAMYMLEKILGVLMDKQDADSSEEAFELVM